MDTRALLLMGSAAVAALAFGCALLIGKRKNARQCWLQLNAQLTLYFGALTPLARYLRLHGYNDADMMTHFKKARDINKSGGGPKRGAAAYAHMQRGLARLERLIETREHLAGDEAFIAMWESLVQNDEKIRFEAAFYNNAVRTYNRLVTRPPTSIVAKAFSFSRMPFFKITDEQKDGDP